MSKHTFAPAILPRSIGVFQWFLPTVYALCKRGALRHLRRQFQYEPARFLVT